MVLSGIDNKSKEGTKIIKKDITFAFHSMVRQFFGLSSLSDNLHDNYFEINKHISEMNKRILSVIVFSAALLSVQAQDGKGGISPAMLGRIQQSYRGTPSDKALRNAIGNNDIRKLALNQENMQDMDTHFSIKVDSKGITDQKSSGRCWLFTGLNVMRAKTLARYGFQSFEFSEIYPFFWDQLEKSNLFLQGIIDTAKSPLEMTRPWNGF